MNIFDTKDAEYIRKELTDMLEEEQREGFVEIIRDDEYFLQAKITPRKRVYFYLHYGAYRFKGKKLDVSIINGHVNIEINGGDLNITNLELNGFLDNVSVCVDY